MVGRVKLWVPRLRGRENLEPKQYFTVKSLIVTRFFVTQLNEGLSKRHMGGIGGFDKRILRYYDVSE